MSVCWTDSKQTIEDLLVVMKEDASVTAGFVNFFYGLSTAAELYGTAERHTSAFGYGENSH